VSLLEQTTTARAATPRVNLLPPEIAQEKRFNQLRLGLAGAIVATLAGTGVLYIVAEQSKQDAATELQVEQDRGATISRESAQYAAVPQVEAETQAAESTLQTAMGQEVRWSFFLNDLTSAMPADAWLTSLTMTQPVDSSDQSATSPAPVLTTPGIASLTYAGVGRSYPAIAAWLDAQEYITTSDDPYVTNSADSKIGEADVVTFTTTASVNTSAYSGRYNSTQGPPP